MYMKPAIMKLNHLILTIGALAGLSACSNSTEYIDAYDGIDFNLHYRIQTKNGIKTWGLVENHQENMPELEIERIPCLFDSIYEIHNILKEAYVCEKDGIKYAYDRYGNLLWDDGQFTQVSLVGENDSLSSATFGNQDLAKFCVDRGYMFVFYYGSDYNNNIHGGGEQIPIYYALGPYENLYAGVNGYAYQQNGKWGIMKATPGKQYGGGEYLINFMHLADPIYEGVIEVVNHRSLGPFWLVKINGQWLAIDLEGKTLKVSQNYIRSLLSTKISPRQDFHKRSTTRRIGNNTVGCVNLQR